MNAKDLMLGDFVQFDKDVCIVEEVRVDGTVVLVSLNTDLTSIDGDQVSIDEISPIELTAEILDRNYYQYKEYANGKHIEYVSPDKRIILTDDEMAINTHNKWSVHVDTEDMRTMGYFEITYVHELQHCLRFCNIEKEIEL